MTSKELHEDADFEQVLELEHEAMIPFIQKELMQPHPLIRQFVQFNWLFTFGALAFAVVQLYQGILAPGPMILHFLLGVVLSMTVLIPVHEGIHGLAYRLVGAPSVQFGGSFRKMYFYAVADHYVLKSKEFRLVALAPFVLILLVGVVVMTQVAPIFQWVLLGLIVVHNWNCIGDFVMLGFLERFRPAEMYTYDDVSGGKSYFFTEKINQ